MIKSKLRRSLRDFLNATWRKWRLGFNPSDCWDLRFSCAKFMLPRLKYFKTHIGSYPYGMTFEEWQDILGKMIRAFEVIQRDTIYCEDEKTLDEMNEGIELFHKYFNTLWS